MKETPAAFVQRCWERAARGVGEDERETIAGDLLDAEVYSACDLTRLSFTTKNGAKLRLDVKVLEALEKAHGLTRDVRTPLDASGDFNVILNKGGRYVARITPEKLFCEPKACSLELGDKLVDMYVTKSKIST